MQNWGSKCLFRFLLIVKLTPFDLGLFAGSRVKSIKNRVVIIILHATHIYLIKTLRNFRNHFGKVKYPGPNIY